MYCGQFIAFATITVNWPAISVRGGMISGPSFGDTHIDLEIVDGMPHNKSYFIEMIPFVRITLDAVEHT